jgi:branched-subunit amino acid permease
VLAAYTFYDVMLTMFVFFAWILFLGMLFIIFRDLFGRHDISGWAKAGWAFFVIVLPFLGILVYIIVEGSSMAEHAAQRREAAAGPVWTPAQLEVSPRPKA